MLYFRRETNLRVVFQKGGFGGCSPGTKTGTRVHSDVPPERKPGMRVRSHVPPERRPERGHIRQNHPDLSALSSPSDIVFRKFVQQKGDVNFLGLPNKLTSSKRRSLESVETCGCLWKSAFEARPVFPLSIGPTLTLSRLHLHS